MTNSTLENFLNKHEMTTLRQAAQQALEALEAFLSDDLSPYDAAKIITALKTALQEPPELAPLKRGLNGRCTRKVCECEKEGLGPECIYLEPVAWVVYDSANNDIAWTEEGKRLKANTPLYTNTRC